MRNANRGCSPTVSLASCWARPWQAVASTPTSCRSTRPATNCLPKTFTYVAVSRSVLVAFWLTPTADDGGGGGGGDDDLEHGLIQTLIGPPGGLPAIEQVRPAVGGQNGCRRAQTEISRKPLPKWQDEQNGYRHRYAGHGSTGNPRHGAMKTSDCFSGSASATLYNISNHHTYTITSSVKMLLNCPCLSKRRQRGPS